MNNYWSSSPLLLLLVLNIPLITTSTSIQTLSNVTINQDEFSLTPLSFLSTAANATIGNVRTAIASMLEYNPMPLGRMKHISVHDCLELLDLSMDEISWSIKRMMNFPFRLTSNDMVTWLSAALSNQDTCLEGFRRSRNYVRRPVKVQLDQITRIVGDMLAMVRHVHNMPLAPILEEAGEGRDFPSWMTDKTKRIFHGAQRGMRVNAVVALDGSGNYRSIMDAIKVAPDHSNSKYIIHVKGGVYNEIVEIKRKKTNIVLIGDGAGFTIISGNRNVLQGYTTFRTATFAVSGAGFIARDITFRNTAGPTSRQAVALRVDSDKSAFFRCNIEGYQDTLYAHSLRQFYRECKISGTVDFIFGNAAAVFQDCTIYARKPLNGQKITVTAQARKDPNQNTGFVIHNSRVETSPELSGAAVEGYLGRPWKPFSRTIFMQSNLGGLIRPQGWLDWQGTDYSRSVYYAEYQNYGPGSDTSQRVRWPGYHILTDEFQAGIFTVARFIDGLSWLPATGVMFNSGLRK